VLRAMDAQIDDAGLVADARVNDTDVSAHKLPGGGVLRVLTLKHHLLSPSLVDVWRLLV